MRCLRAGARRGWTRSLVSGCRRSALSSSARRTRRRRSSRRSRRPVVTRSGHGRERKRSSSWFGRGSRGSARPPLRRSLGRSASTRATLRSRWLRSKPRASASAGASVARRTARRPRRSNTASDVSSHAFIDARSTASGREIEPVAVADYLRFLVRWQRVEEPAEGQTGLAYVLRLLEGFEAPASAWEHESTRGAGTRGDDPSWDRFCGVSRGRSPGGAPRHRRGTGRASASVRQSPIAIVARDEGLTETNKVT